ncbi:MAG: GNAT family N-acetyltransferase [Nanoarchaeota archaeon]|nr:GNAT family N-acetyltransferase [Nanoarchaeota archaeon]
MLEFKDLSLSNWNEVEGEILRLEELLFPEKIRGTREEFIGWLSEERNVAFLAYLNDVLIGCAIGAPLESQDPKWPGTQLELKTKKHWGRYDTIHGINAVVHPELHGRGYGRAIYEEYARRAKEMGYKRRVGYCRPNATLHILKSQGAKELLTCKNWFGTGEDYVYVELYLKE